MTDTALVSVRGTAQLYVQPDAAHFMASLTASGESAPESLGAAARRADNVCSGLDELGGQEERVGMTERASLAYSRASIVTREEKLWDEAKRIHIPTGKFLTDVGLRVTVRDFDKVEAVTRVLAERGASLARVIWEADRDNAGWRTVRKAAVTAAVAQARDYADALKGSVVSLEHLADSGLLVTDGGRGSSDGAPMARAAGLGQSQTEVPELTPVPQRLTATVEARFHVNGVQLPAN